MKAAGARAAARAAAAVFRVSEWCISIYIMIYIDLVLENRKVKMCWPTNRLTRNNRPFSRSRRAKYTIIAHRHIYSNI